MQPELIADYACHCGESPVWHPDERRLYWTDNMTGRLFWYDPASGRHQPCYEDRVVGGMTVQADGSLLLFRDEGNIVVWRDGKVLKTIVEEIPRERGRRFNDVIADPQGRVFCGIIGDITKKESSLYRLDHDGTLTLLLDGIVITNGMAFTPDLKKMYYTDTGIDEIWLFDYNESDGSIGNKHVFVSKHDEPIKPDGMTVDANGDIWSAMALGGCLIKYSPQGEELKRIKFPVKLTTSLTFAGDDLADVYVTSGKGDAKGAEWGEAAGSLYRLNVGVKGVPEFRSRVRI